MNANDLLAWPTVQFDRLCNLSPGRVALLFSGGKDSRALIRPGQALNDTFLQIAAAFAARDLAFARGVGGLPTRNDRTPAVTNRSRKTR